MSTVLWTHKDHCSEAQTTAEYLRYHRYVKSESTRSTNSTNHKRSPGQVQNLPHDNVLQFTRNPKAVLDYQFHESHQQSQFIAQTATSLLQNYTMDNMPYWWTLDHATTFLEASGYDVQHDLQTMQERPALRQRNAIHHYMYQVWVPIHRCVITIVIYRLLFEISMVTQWSVLSLRGQSTTLHYQHSLDSTDLSSLEQ